jgi:nitrite reductase/ring-hydroxylating ferredoxin subunit
VRRTRIAALRDVPEGATFKFQFTRKGRKVVAFLARVRGRFVAYENVCRHLPLTLDFDNNQIFTADGKHFFCQTHGAVYDPLTGLCIHGPCLGARLKPLRVEAARGIVWLIREESSAAGQGSTKP